MIIERERFSSAEEFVAEVYKQGLGKRVVFAFRTGTEEHSQYCGVLQGPRPQIGNRVKLKDSPQAVAQLIVGDAVYAFVAEV